MPSEARRQATMVDLDDVYMDADLNNRFIGDTDDETKELAASIESTNGLLQPIGIAPTPESHKTSHDKPYELVWGFRRCRALRYLDECNGTNAWTKNVDAVLEEASTKDRIVNQLIENLQRKDLNPMEVALSMKSALEDKEAGLNQTDLAKLIGMAVPTVSNYLKAATKLSTNIQGLVLAGKLGWSHAKVIMGLDIPTEQQEQLAGIASV